MRPNLAIHLQHISANEYNKIKQQKSVSKDWKFNHVQCDFSAFYRQPSLQIYNASKHKLSK